MADHPDLVIKSKTAQPIQHAAADLPQEIITCRLCLDEAEDAVKTACRHIFCRECVRQYLETAIEFKPECPVCHLPMSIDLDQDAIQVDETGRQGFLARIDPTKSRTSTKIEALLEELSKTRTEDRTLKTLVFSQFTTMLCVSLSLVTPSSPFPLPSADSPWRYPNTNPQRPRRAPPAAQRLQVCAPHGHHDAHCARQHDQALFDRPRVHRVPHLAQGWRRGHQPRRRQPRHHPRPVRSSRSCFCTRDSLELTRALARRSLLQLVEPGCRAAGHGPRAPHRPACVVVLAISRCAFS